MPLDKQIVENFDTEAAKDFKGVPIGKIVCIARAAWKAYKCETGGGQHCIQTLIAEIEVCLRS